MLPLVKTEYVLNNFQRHFISTKYRLSLRKDLPVFSAYYFNSYSRLIAYRCVYILYIWFY